MYGAIMYNDKVKFWMAANRDFSIDMTVLVEKTPIISWVNNFRTLR